jgi:hypothetical protein
MNRLNRYAKTACLVVVGLCAVVAASTGTAVGSLQGGTAVEIEASSAVWIPGLTDTVGVWVKYEYPMSIDCSPPRGCYAKSQRIYYFANCAIGALAQVQSIFMNLNGDVVAQTEPDFNAPWYVPPASSPEYLALRNICTLYQPR